ncbi:MAG: hypothetical protein ACYC4L_11100 [Chloroflexota bacterium]
MGSLIKWLPSLVVITLVVGVLVLGYLGFVPGVASAFGADKPRDLEVKYGQASIDSASTKAKAKLEVLSAGVQAQQSLQLSASKVPAAASFTSAELSGLVASHESKWAYHLVSNCQIRINTRDDRLQRGPVAGGV